MEKAINERSDYNTQFNEDSESDNRLSKESSNGFVKEAKKTIIEIFYSITKNLSGLYHIAGLVWKNYMIAKANKKSQFLHIVMIFLINFSLCLIQYSAFAFRISEEGKVKETDLSAFQMSKCIPFNEWCYTLGYSVYSTTSIPEEKMKLYKFIISEVSRVNDLSESDVRFNDKYHNPDDLLSHLEENENRYKLYVIFCYDSISVSGGFSIPCKTEFSETDSIFYTVVSDNKLALMSSLVFINISTIQDMNPLKLKLDIDNAIMKAFTKDSKMIPNISISVASSPKIQLERPIFNYIQILGSSFNFFICASSFLGLVGEMTREKELFVRRSLRLIGVSDFSYLFSWLITEICSSFLTATIQLLFVVLLIFGIQMSFIDLCLYWLINFLFFLSMQTLGMFLSIIIDSSKKAVTVSYGIIILGLLFQSLSLTDGLIKMLFDNFSSIIWIFNGALMLFFPPYNYAVAYFVYSRYFKFQEYSDGLFPKQFAEKLKFFEALDGGKSPIPSTAFFTCALGINAVFLFLLTCYFDHIIESNRGRPDPWYFIVSPKYWIDLCRSKKNNKGLKDSYVNLRSKYLEKEEAEPVQEGVDESIKKEKDRVYDYLDTNSEMDFTDDKIMKTLRVIGLQKIYTYSKGFNQVVEREALKPIHFLINKNEIFTILGHNGAGKSTLISLLTQNTRPSSGRAIIYGKDLEIDAIQGSVGLCPQHDILWDDLTIEEHLLLYIYLLQITHSGEDIDDFIDSILKPVNLNVKKQVQIKQLSGGMKRRLSILLSSISKPNVIILDEPTTGLDPINKRLIWELILRLREERSIVLTTHDMDEAEYLSDRVGIIKEGVLKTLNTISKMKQQYGSGYLLTFICGGSINVSITKEEIEKNFPSARIIGTEGGSIIANLSSECLKELHFFFKFQTLLQKKKNGYSKEQLLSEFGYDIYNQLSKLIDIVDELGFDNTKLEEVFYKVSYINYYS